MQQRQLRLGDIVDDYCPRERRVTNHAIVAMVDQDVKQTRCTTCDAEHEYKQARVPPQRKKKAAPGALYQEVLAGMPRKTPSPAAPQPPESLPPATEPEPVVETPAAPAGQALAPAPADPREPGEPHAETEETEGPVHRPLIRATLPRPEGQAPVRQAPEFTIRQPSGRPGRFRPGAGRRAPGGPAANGNFHFSGRRNAGAAAGGPYGHGNRSRPPGDRHAQPQHRRRGGKKPK
jgi:hypothetical protein